MVVLQFMRKLSNKLFMRSAIKYGIDSITLLRYMRGFCHGCGRWIVAVSRHTYFQPPHDCHRKDSSYARVLWAGSRFRQDYCPAKAFHRQEYASWHPTIVASLTLQCKGSAPKSHTPFLVPLKAAMACSNGVDIFYQISLRPLAYSNFFRSSTSGNASRSFSGMSEFMR